jgi:hypothetical protein
MSRENSKKRASSALVIDTTAQEFGLSGLPESYQSQVKVRSEMQRPASGEMPAAPEGTDIGAGKQALPAWIKAQVEQLEMRRLARHSAYLKGLPDMQGD